MKQTKLATAIGLVLGAGAIHSSWALLPGAVPEDDQVNQLGNRLYISGATATDQLLGRMMLASVADGGLCNAGTIDVYTTAGDAGATTAARIQNIFGSANKATLCTASANTHQVGTPIGIFKESTAGSENGVDPVALGTNVGPSGAALKFLNLASATATECNSPVTIPAINAQTVAFNVHFSCSLTQQRAPHVGMSDVNPALLTNNQTVVDNLLSTGEIQVMFAPAVTLKLYRELQAAEGLNTSCADGNANGVADCDEQVNVPSLTLAQMRGLMTGSYQSWSKLRTDSNALVGSNTGENDTVYICRRGRTSGTEATFESVMLNLRCASGVASMQDPTNAACVAGGCVWNATTQPSYIGDRIFAGAGSGDVRNCLNAHDDHLTGSNTIVDRALGFLSMESSPPNIGAAGGDGNTAVGTDAGWRFIGLNRVNPELLTAIEGNWDLWSESTWNVPADVPGLVRSDVQETLQGDIVGSIGNLTVIKNLNEGFAWVTGQAAYLAIPGPAASATAPPQPPFTRATPLAKPVNPNTRSPLGATNDCNPPTVFGTPTEAGGLDQGHNTANAPVGDL